MLKAISPFGVLSGVGSLLLALVSLPAFAQHYTRTDLTSNVSGAAPNFDATSGQWLGPVARNYFSLVGFDAGEASQRCIMQPALPESVGRHYSWTERWPWNPTGTVFNYTTGFEAAPGVKSIFLWVTVEGTIDGWNPAVKPTEAVVLKDRKGKAVFTGVHPKSPTGSAPFYMQPTSRLAISRFTTRS